ncbi:hypothetical protein BDV95DRAFT_502751 [Massariosphaeria phaeospora]|uniref:Stealth protein CR1 conserved region 1 domain-containing protein n=1 Tax=Massariosphaeria phaeospora TaxID=100035 RepID=A0A7C8MHT7_9PLEO|nr:hypothetical protein BDV95DRAFT_502751 [Massariosphaeria phaeospora]
MEPKQTLAARTSPEIVDDAFDEEVSSDSHYPRHRLNSINDLADLYPNSFPSSSPEPHVHSQGQSTHNVEHAVKSAKSDEDDAMFNRKLSSFDSDRQIRIDNTGTKATLKQHPHRSLLPKKASEDITEEETYLVESLDTPQGDTSHPLETTKKHKPLDRGYTFPSWSECEETKDKADVLPDMIHVPFEQSVRDVILEGWEDEWIATASYTGPRLDEPKIDFVYNWVNGSQPEMVETMHPYELNSTLNDEEGEWISSHGSNRYREWDELRYSVRSVEKYAGRFTNRIQILMNAFRTVSEEESAPHTYGKQHPNWLKGGLDKVQVLSQEEFFGPDEMKCLPTFDSLTIENQLYNTKSEVDRLFALSDDMILGKPHSASDIYSPLFGPTLGFKDNAYNTLQPPTEKDADRFGEKPFLIYTSWLLNRRFGARKRKGQVHFGHSLSRSITKEAITSFPRPALRSAIQRFRGETGFQLYSWYVIFHYTMERHREALLWSYIMLRSDTDDDGYLSWNERKRILRELNEGMANEAPEQFRHRMYYRVGDYLAKAGLQPPIVNTDILWTSLDGPAMIKDLDCDAFDTEDCLAPGFSIPASDAEARSPVFSSAAIFDRVARESPRCGDCLLKLILNRRSAGLGPLLPHPVKKPEQRAIVVKAVMKYQYTIVNPDAMFYMVTDAEQAEHALLKPYIKHNKKVGQMCLNDDVATADVEELEKLRKVMKALFEGLLPEPSSFEK